eukprot:179209-Rhodomonas_salina.3
MRSCALAELSEAAGAGQSGHLLPHQRARGVAREPRGELQRQHPLHPGQPAPWHLRRRAGE